MAQLEDIMDIVDLNIKSLNSLSSTTRENWEKAEQYVMKKYNVPSLTAYLLYEYHFNNQSLHALSSKVGVSSSTLYYIVHALGIPLKTRSQAQSQANPSRGLLEQKIKKEYGMSLYDYLLCEYHFNNKTPRVIGAKLGRSHQGIINIMRDLGISINECGGKGWTPELRKHISEIMRKRWKERDNTKTIQKLKERLRKFQEQNRGKTYEEIYGLEKAKEVLAKISGENNHMYGKKHTAETRRKMSLAKLGKNHPMFGKHLPLEWRRKISLARKQSITLA